MKTQTPNTARPDRRGFTIVELLVVSVLGSLLLMATYQILITNQRTYAVQAEKVQGMQATRAGLDILTGELREISTEGGDLISMDSTALQIRTMRRFGIVCAATYGSTPTITVARYDLDFDAQDSVFVFAENDDGATSDDTWIPARITSIDTTATCGPREAGLMYFSGQQALFVPGMGGDSVSPGAPVRSYDRYAYGKTTIDGQVVLARRDAGGTVVPLVGPLDQNGGLRFTYLDEYGNTTTTATDVEQIILTLKSTSEATGAQGQRVQDSMSVRIYARN